MKWPLVTRRRFDLLLCVLDDVHAQFFECQKKNAELLSGLIGEAMAVLIVRKVDQLSRTDELAILAARIRELGDELVARERTIAELRSAWSAAVTPETKEGAPV